MGINNDDYPCNFCKRDEGLRLFINRYILCTGANIKSKENNKEKKQPDPLYIEKSSSIFDNPSGIEIRNEENISQLKTLTYEAKDSYSKLLNCHQSLEGYGFRGSVLRKGYLYVFMEHLGVMHGWQEYEVSDAGFLKRINEENFFGNNSIIIKNEKVSEEPCSKISHKAHALTIVVPKALEAKNIYLKYSENKWSKKTKENNKNNYKEFMNGFNVESFLNGSEQHGVYPMASGINKFNVDSDSYLDSSLKEKQWDISYLKWNISKNKVDIKSALNYLTGVSLVDIYETMDDKEVNADDAFELASYRITDNNNNKLKELNNILNEKPILEEEKPYFKDTIFKNYTEEEIAEAYKDPKKLRLLFGALVTIDDPVGIVMDVSSNIAGKLSDDSDYTDFEKTVNTINVLKHQYMGINDDEFYNENELKLKDQAMELMQIFNGQGVALGGAIQDKQESRKTDTQKNAEEIQRKKQEQDYKNQKWMDDYQIYIDREKFDKASESLSAKKKIQGDIADKLDLLGGEYLEKQYLRDHFKFNIEKDNLLDAISLMTNVICIIESAKLSPKMNEIIAQYIYRFDDTDNYVLNGIALNSTNLRKKLNDALNKYQTNDLNGLFATQPTADLSNATKAWLDNGAKIYKTTLPEIKNVVQISIGKLLANLFSFKPPQAFQFHPIIPLTVSIATQSEIKTKALKFAPGNRGQFNMKVLSYVRNLNNLMNVKGLSNDSLGTIIARDPYWGKVFEKVGKLGVFYIPHIDFTEQYLKTLPKDYRKVYESFIKILDGKPATVEMTYANPGEGTDILREENIARFSVVKLAVAHLQVWSFWTVFNDTSLTNDNYYEKTGRRVAASLGLMTGLVELSSNLLNTFDRAISKRPFFNLLGKILNEIVDGKRIANFVWRLVGLTGGVIFGIYDVYNGLVAIKDGEKKYGRLLASSGLMLIFGSIMVFANAPIVGVILIFIAIVLSITAYAIRQDKIKNWMRRCILSTDEEITHFPDYVIQAQNLKEIFS